MNPAVMSKILLVDDEKDILNLLEDVLLREGFKKIYRATDGGEAIKLSRSIQPDVIILDIMLPDIDGITVCKEIRSFSTCPVIFLSSKNDDIDKIVGLSSGADDYVTKPFSPKEVAFRVKSQLRRASYYQSESKTMMETGEIRIDLDSKRIYKKDYEVQLTAREYHIMEYLFQNIGKIISKEQLYEQIWREKSIGIDNTLMVHIRHLRQKLENDPSNPSYISTVKGLGYCLEKIEP